MNDIRFALRSLAKAPGVTLLTLITIALGIGACSAIFTVVNSVLLRPVDYPQSESLMVIRQNKLPQFPTFSICPADFLDFQREGDRFESMYAQRGRSYILTGGGQPQRLQGSSATASMFATLRVQPALGRAFTTEEDVPGKNHVVVISHAFWQSQFGGRADVLGQSLLLNGTPHAVIGVMPESFRQGSKFDVLTPIAFTAEQKVDRGGHYVSAVGRLKPGVTVEEADAQLKAIAAQLAQTYPDGNEGWSAYIVPMLEWNTGSLRPTLFTLLGAVGFLLLIACANVGNLQLARATARRREITVRAALGASSTRIVRLLLTESVILGVAGGVLGLLIANWSLDGLLALGGNQIPRAAEVGLDGRVVVFTLGLSLLTGLAFGLVPAWQCRRLDLVDAMKSGARGGGDASRHRLRNGLVVAEIALALVMLAGAGLLGRSFVRLAAADPGFESHDAWWVSVGLPRERYDSNEKLVAFTNAVEERFRALPGVADVGTTMVMPFSNNDYVLALSFPDREFSAAESPSTNYSIATPGYFSTMRIPLKQGRTFTDADRAGAPRVAGVSETFVERMFPHQSTRPTRQRGRPGKSNLARDRRCGRGREAVRPRPISGHAVLRAARAEPRWVFIVRRAHESKRLRRPSREIVARSGLRRGCRSTCFSSASRG